MQDLRGQTVALRCSISHHRSPRASEQSWSIGTLNTCGTQRAFTSPPSPDSSHEACLLHCCRNDTPSQGEHTLHTYRLKKLFTEKAQGQLLLMPKEESASNEVC